MWSGIWPGDFVTSLVISLIEGVWCCCHFRCQNPAEPPSTSWLNFLSQKVDVTPNDPDCKMQTAKGRSGINTSFIGYDRIRFTNSMESEVESKSRFEKLKETVRRNISKTLKGKQKVEEKVIEYLEGNSAPKHQHQWEKYGQYVECARDGVNNVIWQHEKVNCF